MWCRDTFKDVLSWSSQVKLTGFTVTIGEIRGKYFGHYFISTIFFNICHLLMIQASKPHASSQTENNFQEFFSIFEGNVVVFDYDWSRIIFQWFRHKMQIFNNLCASVFLCQIQTNPAQENLNSADHHRTGHVPRETKTASTGGCLNALPNVKNLLKVKKQKLC